MDPIVYYLFPLFLFIAIVYSSVGFGGGSSYVAVLALVNFSHLLTPKIALICNLIVVSSGVIIFYRKGFLSIKKAFPFVIGSIPMAFIGGLIEVDNNTFKWILATALLLSVVKILFFPNKPVEIKNSEGSFSLKQRWSISLAIGSLLGFLAGLVGIGGGVFLAPALHIMNWGKAKEIAATASFFILCNSFSGLVGQFTKRSGSDDLLVLLPFAIAVLIGGQIGSRIAVKVIKEAVIKKATAIVVFIASLWIYFDLLFKIKT